MKCLDDVYDDVYTVHYLTIVIGLFAADWYVTLFTRSFPLSFALPIWDVLLIEGTIFLFSFFPFFVSPFFFIFLFSFSSFLFSSFSFQKYFSFLPIEMTRRIFQSGQSMREGLRSV